MDYERKYDATVLVSICNRPDYVEPFLDAFAAQTCPADRFEIIVVDDSGKDGYDVNKRVIEAIKGKYGFDIRYFVTGLPKDVYGNTVARNIGLAASRSDLIICIDDDCLAHTHFVEKHIEEHRKADRVIVSGVRVIDKAKLAQPLPVEVDDPKSMRHIEKYRTNSIGAGAFLGANASMKKKHLERIGGWNENLANRNEYGYTDRELGMRLLGLDLRVVLCVDAIIYHRPTENEVVQFRKKNKSADRAHSRFKRIQRIYKAKRILAAILRCVPVAGKDWATELLKPKRVYTSSCPKKQN